MDLLRSMDLKWFGRGGLLGCRDGRNAAEAATQLGMPDAPQAASQAASEERRVVVRPSSQADEEVSAETIKEGVEMEPIKVVSEARAVHTLPCSLLQQAGDGLPTSLRLSLHRGRHVAN
eukprot:5119-Chlamydomonas_euryale.AAC.3